LRPLVAGAGGHHQPDDQSRQAQRAKERVLDPQHRSILQKSGWSGFFSLNTLIIYAASALHRWREGQIRLPEGPAPSGYPPLGCWGCGARVIWTVRVFTPATSAAPGFATTVAAAAGGTCCGGARVTLTWSPGRFGQSSRRRSLVLRTGWPSIAMIRSLGCNPACAAGELGTTAWITAPGMAAIP